MNSNIRYLLNESRRFLNLAFEEFKRGLNEERDEVIRDDAEKSWNAIVQATAALLLFKGFKEEEAKTYKQKRTALEDLGIRDETIRKLGFRDRFMAKENTLHIKCFYDGEYRVEVIREEIEKTKQYIDDIEKLLKGTI
ncbi:MAG: hypothetical protein QW534_06515 [Candidatus Methanomethylicia archaeon]